jgi:hypothetical protein
MSDGMRRSKTIEIGGVKFRSAFGAKSLNGFVEVKYPGSVWFFAGASGEALFPSDGKPLLTCSLDALHEAARGWLEKYNNRSLEKMRKS